MLNRGDAPSAQLFAISEEAEIRYTNCGLLYEVPAAERSNSVVSPDPVSGRSMSSMSMELLDRYVACAFDCCWIFSLCGAGLAAFLFLCFWRILGLRRLQLF